MSESRSSLYPESGLLRSNLTVAAGTALSRLTGLARIIIFGVIVGQTALADAFDAANNAPNAIYELFIGGVLSASLVPLFTRYSSDHDGDHRADHSANQIADHGATEAIFSVTLVALVVCTGLAILAAPQIFHLFSLYPSAGIDVAQFRSAGTMLTRIFLVQIFFYGLSALCSALLNSRRKFFAAAWSPVLANCVAIAFLLLLPLTTTSSPPSLLDVLDNQTFKLLLGLGSTLGIATMAIVMYLSVRTTDLKLRFRPNFSHPAVGQLLRLSLWTLGYVVANQIALVVIKNLASPGSGNVDAYAKAMVLLQLPHGLLAVSIATTFMPELARRSAARDEIGFAQQMTSGLRLTAMLVFPSGIGLLILSRPIIGLVLQHGNFDVAASINTGRALSGMALGLIGFSIYLFTLRGFYARNDARTPFFINLFENALNIIFAFALVGRYGVLGLGLAFSLAYIVAALVALVVLHVKVEVLSVPSVLRSLSPIVAATVVMGAAVYLCAKFVGTDYGLGALARVGSGLAVGGTVYWLALIVFKVDELRDLKSRLRRKN